MKKEIIELLSNHYYKNIELGVYYLELAKQVNNFGMINLSKYIIELSNDKLITHKNIIYNYFLESGTDFVGNLKEIKFTQFESPKLVAEHIYKIESEIKKEVNKIADVILDSKDHETYNFWQWFIKDVSKDIGEINYISNLFKMSNDILLIDHMVQKSLKN